MAATGASAAYAALPADSLTSIPDNLPLVRAAALPGPGLTAWQALFEHASLKPSNRIRIIGAGGAVGGYAVQLAHQTGATVTATASARSEKMSPSTWC
jgi:NADPH:quinone reductase-like Zn-dependent oxidoreductase